MMPENDLRAALARGMQAFRGWQMERSRLSAAWLAMAACLCAIVSCGSPVHAAEPESNWVLEKGRDVGEPVQQPQLRMEGDRLSGTTGCNRFTARVTEQPDKRVSIANVTTTRMMCAPKENDNERAILRAFQDTQYLARDGARLIFKSAAQESLLDWKQAGAQQGAAPAEPAPRTMGGMVQVPKAGAAPTRRPTAKASSTAKPRKFAKVRHAKARAHKTRRHKAHRKVRATGGGRRAMMVAWYCPPWWEGYAPVSARKAKKRGGKRHRAPHR
jgi:heat shock protein HslJ